MITPQKIGHRGAKGHLEENTLESIEKALEMGVDAIEIDVHKCKTGELVVIHDFTLNRTTNGEGEVALKSLKEIKGLKIKGKYKIPLLTEVLDFIEGKCWINIELKGLNTADKTCAVINEYVRNRNWTYEKFIVSSFNENELYKVYRTDTKIPLGVLTEDSVTKAIALGELIMAKAIHPSLEIVTRENVKKSQLAGFKVNVWTVNTQNEVTRMKEFGVDGIISDLPELL